MLNILCITKYHLKLSMIKITISKIKAYALQLSFILFVALLGCSKQKAPEPKPADDMMMAPAPPPKPMPTVETKPTVVEEDQFQKANKKWDDIRSNEEKYLGETIRFERLKVISVYGDVLARTENWKYVSITGELGTYEFERGMGTENYIRLRKEDWIDVSGKFEGISSSGEISIQLKKIKNLGYIKED
jgi:hypothetical protein